MKITVKYQLTLLLGTMLAVFAPMAAAHGLDGHHAPFMFVLQHLLTEHGYLLVLPVALGMVWFARYDKRLHALLVRLRRSYRSRRNVPRA